MNDNHTAGDVEAMGLCYCGGTVTKTYMQERKLLAGGRFWMCHLTCDRGGDCHVTSTAEFNRALADLLLTREAVHIGTLRSAAMRCAEIGLSEFARILDADVMSAEGHIARAGDILRSLGRSAGADSVYGTYCGA